MKFITLGLGLSLALASSSCTLNDVKTPDSFRDRLATQRAIDTRGAYPSWRWIGIKNDADAPCPKIRGFKERQLFPLGIQRNGCAVGESDALEAVAEELDRFCVWERDKGTGGPIPLAADLSLSRLEPDAVAMTAAVQIPGTPGPYGKQIAGLLETHFVQHMGPGSRLGEFDPVAHPIVRLAFIDSEPTAESIADASKGRIEHGYFLSLLGRKLGGPGVAITSQLALPIVYFDAIHPERSLRDEKGGFVGSFADLAEAIHREVAAWQRRDQRLGRHLVLNLSVGWDGEQFGGLTEQRVCDLPPGPRAVYLALEYANRQGALIFAAAGNAQAGPGASKGPLLPAAWERGNIRDSACGKGLGRPLLYAVGGVQGNGAPIANTRPGSMPKLAAYADHVSLTHNGSPTSTYTGTSVATAVVSSIAARLWFENQNYLAETVVAKLRGTPLPYEPSEFFREREPRYVKEITLCSEFGLGCAERGRPVLPGVPGDPANSVDLAPILKVSPACGGGEFYRVGSASLSRPLCPSQMHEGRWSAAWIIPQPESDPCPSCSIGPIGTARSSLPVVLRVEINQEWIKAKEILLGGTLEVQLATGRLSKIVFDLPEHYKSEPPFDIRLPADAFGDGAPVKAANISWLVSGSRSSSINTPVLLTD